MNELCLHNLSQYFILLHFYFKFSQGIRLPMLQNKIKGNYFILLFASLLKVIPSWLLMILIKRTALALFNSFQLNISHCTLAKAGPTPSSPSLQTH